jgi:antibiotic biosynthesis monooxygenase (ABM) superfamily enzyme
MSQAAEKTIVSKFLLKEKHGVDFSQWQASLHSQIVTFSGFISLEILAPRHGLSEWTIIQRFDNQSHSRIWLNSKEYHFLQETLRDLTEAVREEELTSSKQDWEVTEIFVTKVTQEKTDRYNAWIGKIHEAESKFPGFRGVYVKAPNPGHGENWITLLRFDSQEHLDGWLTSKERKEILNEAETLITSLQSHRVNSPFAGWFANTTREEHVAVWKQTCLVLLVLFPIVMMELKFLSPLTKDLNPSLRTFISNVISVLLISWPMTPIVIYFLKWWLLPSDTKNTLKINLLGFIVILMLYLLEIAIFWHLL